MSKAQSPSFTESAEALDDILDQFKSGGLQLEESLELFEEGIKHLKLCQSALTTTKGKVEVLMKDLQNSGLTTENFDDEE